jgi:glyoxylase-like metal-dependent hydrolase (beta-lactamase superfamily II)
MKEILPGIYQITLTLSGFNPSSINVYLIRDKDGYALIDTGWDSPPSVSCLQKQIAEKGVLFSDIKRVIITHCHIDHLGLIGRLKRSNNATIYLHENEIPLIKVRFRNGDQFIPMTDKFLREHGVPEPELVPPEAQIPNIMKLTEPDVLLRGDEVIRIGAYNFRVINTPGHTPGHISLYEPQNKFLISGDVLLPTIATNAALHIQNTQNPLQKHINSLLTLRQLDIELVLPGHEYVFSGHRQRIDELIDRYREKDSEVLKALADGQPKTAYDVSKILSGSLVKKSAAWQSLSGWDKRFAVLQSIACLEQMTFTEKLSRFSVGGTIYYQARSY